MPGYLELLLFTLSAIDNGVKDVRAVIEQARFAGHALVFIDEIHRFNKAQQDSLLGAVERGIITLIGATTENPSFEIIPALLSRCQVYTLQNLTEEELKKIVVQALENDEWLRERKVEIGEWEALILGSGGDARRLLNLLELSISALPEQEKMLTNERVKDVLQNSTARYDKSGEQHYDIISAFIKSLRGSDPNGALYWMARMIRGGEDPKFIASRMVIMASEDICNANPNALLLATTAFQAVQLIGWPESGIILAQCTTYLACSPKSNASYLAINEAQNLVEKWGDLTAPLPLRNAATQMMKNMDYGLGYQYAHDFPGHFVMHEYLPEKLGVTILYIPRDSEAEARLGAYLRRCWGQKYGY